MNSSNLKLMALGYGIMVVAAVLAARLGLYPGVGERYPGDPILAHPYRLAMGLTAVALAVTLGIGAAAAGKFTGNRLAGLAVLLAGGITTGLALAAAPWVLYAHDQYPVPFLWLMVGAPVGLAAWAVATAMTPVRSSIAEV